MSVLSGKKSWVGFSTQKNLKAFPHSKQGVFHPSENLKGFNLSEDEMTEVELNYARHYSAWNDINLLFKNYSLLGK